MRPSNRTELLRERIIFVIEKRTVNSEMSAGCWYKIPNKKPLSHFIPLLLSSQFQTGFCYNADYCPCWCSCTRLRFHCQILQLTTSIQFQYSPQQMLQVVIPESARPENKEPTSRPRRYLRHDACTRWRAQWTLHANSTDPFPQLTNTSRTGGLK